VIKVHVNYDIYDMTIFLPIKGESRKIRKLVRGVVSAVRTHTII